jgi:hypothetical protein
MHVTGVDYVQREASHRLWFKPIKLGKFICSNCSETI